MTALSPRDDHLCDRRDTTNINYSEVDQDTLNSYSAEALMGLQLQYSTPLPYGVVY